VSFLEVNDLSVRFGGVTAVSHVTIAIDEGVTGVIGPNGAGKSTLFNAITGFVRVREGSVSFDGADISGARPDRIARLGIRRTFQNIRLFGRQSALDNVAMGALTNCRGGSRALKARRRAAEVLEEMNLQHVAATNPGKLPYATQRKIEIARCLAGDPRLILLDEPAAGMHADERAELGELITSLGRSFAVVLVEHDVALVSQVSAEVIVMESGSVLTRGSASDVTSDARVIAAYLGGAV
jgi:branched-chain amino acid transport system ATP-binding protein